MLERSDEITARCNDPDLVIHLVGTHHGRGRPFWRPVSDPTPEVVEMVHDDGTVLSSPSDHKIERLDSGWTDRFWRVTNRYGYWGLAYLEAILRLADHRASQEEEQNHMSRHD
jgi:CRISPR-associated endonuclease/helicase Cas3